MNNKGFVLAETLVVTIFVLLIFTILYNSAIPLLGRYEELSFYDEIDTTYDVYQFRKLLENDKNYTSIISNDYKVLTCNDFDNKDDCNMLYSILNLKSSDLLLFINTDYINNTSFQNSITSYEVKDYLNYVNLESNSNILVLSHDGYISYVELIDHNLKNSILNKTKKINSSCPSYYEFNNITYISGTKDCIDYNYVWYSGKMWRIVAIYPDGSLKLVTDKNITAISYNNDSSFYTNNEATSYIYQFLNEDFYNTLENKENIIDTTKKWDIHDGGVGTNNSYLVQSNVGLLGNIEYNYISHNTPDLNNLYLTNDNYWWLMTNNNQVYYVTSSGTTNNTSTPNSNIYGVRPSIYLKSNILYLKGNGKLDNPYILLDKEIQQDNLYLNQRLSGEYVSFYNDLYRIIEVTDNSGIKVTKLVKVDNLKNTSNAILNKKFSTTNLYGNNLESDLDPSEISTYWDNYLNNTWYSNLINEYKYMLVKGTYYYGMVGNDSNYKLAICLNSNNTTSDCSKASSKELFVGLPRYGEMFASNYGNITSGNTIYLMTPYDSSNVWSIRVDGTGTNASIEESFSVCPTITLSENVKILSGKGLPTNPFKISL